jgi:hypothetical protein
MDGQEVAHDITGNHGQNAQGHGFARRANNLGLLPLGDQRKGASQFRGGFNDPAARRDSEQLNEDAFEANNYWSSTENDASNAWNQNFNNGNQGNNNKDNSYRVRAVRRL